MSRNDETFDTDELAPDAPPPALSAADWEVFLNALDHPPTLPEKLKEAIARRRRLRRDAGRTSHPGDHP